MWKTQNRCGNNSFFVRKRLWIVENCSFYELKIVENLCYYELTSMRLLK